jgi:putative Ig domain-containing protein
MRSRIPATGMCTICVFVFVLFVTATVARAATLNVPAGGDLQSALNAAKPGDIITLQPGATYVGNFMLPNKGVLSDYITIRSAAPDSVFPPAGVRITPAYASQLPKIKSANSMSTLRTAAATNHWKLMFLEFQANYSGYGEIIALGAGDSSQNQLSQVPYAFVLDRVYVHGDPVAGQKRGIALHSRDTAIINSYISECKAVGQDTQAINGFNGPGNYLIENNYLEAAAENFLLGGADPAIPNLVPTNVTFRRNYLSKPLEWRDPIIATPVGVSATAASGNGTLTAGTYYYKVVARRSAGQGNKAASSPSAEVSATLSGGSNGSVTVSWTPVVGAEEYYVYGRTAGTENVYWRTTTPYFADSGATGTSGTPAKVTKWAVKNIFELKNAQDVLVEGNVFENLWVADQPGFPIVFTPRNQYGNSPWTVVQRVTFRNNIVRHTAGGVNVLGVDDVAPSQRTNNLAIYNNVFDDQIASTWGTGSRAFQLGAGPDAITIDHNTVITTNTTIVWLYGGPALSPTPITNTRITNNMSVHSTYGIDGSNYQPGNSSIAAYLPGSVVTGNVLAGGTASKYPAGNFFPTTAAWQAGFVNYAAGDYHLAASSPYKGAGTDGADLGANIDAVMVQTANALTGDNSVAPNTTRVQIATTTLGNGTVNEPYTQLISCVGGSGACGWQVRENLLPAGISFDSVAGLLVGVPTKIETGTISLQAFDLNYPTNTASATLTLTIDPPSFVMTVPSVSTGRVGTPFQIVPSISGAVGTVSWTVASGDLPGGLTLDAFSGTVAGTPTAWGTSTAVIEAHDSWSANRVDSRAVTITIEPTALAVATSALPTAGYHSMYRFDIQASGGTGSTAWSLAGGTLPVGLVFDANGTLSGEPGWIGSTPLTVQATDRNWPGNVATATLLLTVDPPVFSMVMPAIPAAQVGQPLQVTPSVSGNVGAVIWSVVSGSLPGGLSLDAATGSVTGTPSSFGTFTAMLQAQDAWSSSRVVSGAMTITVAPSALVVTTTTLPVAGYRNTYQATLTASGGTGLISWTLESGALPAGLTLSSNGSISGSPNLTGTFPFTVRATDAGWTGNTAVRPLAITVGAREIVLYASDASVISGTWTLVSDPTAAGGVRIANPDKGAAKLATPLASPASYFEITFVAEAGVPYHLWVRGKAEQNSWANDSVMVQFSNSVDASGAPKYRIGTTSGNDVNIEDCSGCGLAGWGWQDNGWGVNVMGPSIYFAQTGPQTIRVQVKEDGMSIDQIVLSGGKYLTVSPGALKNDTTILAR